MCFSFWFFRLTIQNIGWNATNLAGFMLTDLEGREDPDAYTFAPGMKIAGGASLTLCRDAQGSFAFGIHGDDTIMLWGPGGAVIDKTTLRDTGALDRVWTRTGSTWAYHTIAAVTLQLTAVASKGSADRCTGADWISLRNHADVRVSMRGHMITDSNGITHADAFTFPPSTTIAPGATHVLCGKDADSFEFGISSDDKITLWGPSEVVIDTTTLPGGDIARDTVWARAGKTEWAYKQLGIHAPAGPAARIDLLAIADKGTASRCNGADWIRLGNKGTGPVQLGGYMLTDSNGLEDSTAFQFPREVLAAGAEVFLCKGAANSFQFGIGGDDTVTLWSSDGSLVDSTTLGGEGARDKVWYVQHSIDRRS